jgi:hypothetical protein
MGSGLCASVPLGRRIFLCPAFTIIPPPNIANSPNMVYIYVLLFLPFVGLALYLAYLHNNVSGNVQCQTTPYLQDETIAVPDNILCNLKDHVIYHECARKSISTESLGTTSDPEILTLFLRRTMTTLAKSVNTWGLYYLLRDAKERDTFDSAYLSSLHFVPGDRVCGVYVVTSRERERVTLTLDAPASFATRIADGLLVIEVKQEGPWTSFVNHTVMWRKKGFIQPATSLEWAGGRWMHKLMVRRLVESSVQQLLSKHVEEKVA